ncbi:sugar transporter [Clohesyomyces aquaticus]|uniref:Sugar transporter n=1 Tax=Clohesyomyces aquaticus TaxID=1231657 RepID=A0A1Y2A3J4_9PLEO|nr:sugar transporter [Clohesyomyces aquaticus]
MPPEASNQATHLSPRVTRNSKGLLALIILTAMLSCTTQGYDCSMMNGLNILETYTNYFHLNTVTTALNTSIVWMGQFFAGPPGGWVADRYGRKWAMFFAAMTNIIAATLQTASQNMAMFIISRFLIGIGSGVAFAQVPGYVSEVAAWKRRGLTNGLFNCSYLIGGLIAAGITWRMAKLDSTWTWRGPSIVQAFLSAMCMALLPFIPESPRWLISRGRSDEALEVLAAAHTNGEVDDPTVWIQYREILDTIEFERSFAQDGQKAFWNLLKTRGARRRLMIILTLSCVSMLSGNNIVTFYTGQMLTNAGITDTDTQLQINIYLNLFSFVVAVAGTLLIDSLGRKPLGLISMTLMTAFMFILGALTKLYGASSNKSGIYGTVASIFLFNGAYCFGMTPLNTAYSPEVLNYSLRAQGLGFFTTVQSGLGLMVTMAFPIALAKIGWKTYIINGAWDILQIAMIAYYWVETKGRTMEEIDEVIDGEKHSAVPDLRDVDAGKVDIEVHVLREL